jgi:hypothetical protein
MHVCIGIKSEASISLNSLSVVQELGQTISLSEMSKKSDAKQGDSIEKND